MRKQKKKNLRIPFFGGVILFITGVVGAAFHFYGVFTEDLKELFPEKTLFLMEAHLDEDSFQQFSDIFGEGELFKLLDEVLIQKFSFSFSNDVKPWVGSNIGVGILEEGDLVVALQFLNRKKVESFLDNFKTPLENFLVQKTDSGEIWTPEFSSNLAFGFTGKWFLIGTSQRGIESIMNKTVSLKKSEKFQDIFQDLPKKNTFQVYADIQTLVSVLLQSDSFTKYQPIFEALSQTIPAMGLTVKLEEKGLMVESKFLTHKGVFSEREIQKTENQTIPDLTNYAPNDVLFFLNGSDLYAKYLHTKTFLSDLNEQFPVIFDGILRAQSREIFGEEFDFERDFLAKMRGQYAFLIDFENSLYPFLDFTFLTGFGGTDKEQNLSHFHEAIHFAQTRFAPKIEKVELPDGTIREELVSAKPEEVPIRKVEFEDRTYFTAQNPVSDKKFSYGFIDNYFVFSTHESGIKSVVSVAEKKSSNLARNLDFRDSVLFRFSPSESYGFINFTKMVSGLEVLTKLDSDSLWGKFWKSNIRNVTFARKVFPGEVFIKAIFFSR
ncbi:DUF3352 domain-containing protein [Candidatus Gracilibacteria bacterium]|nr:DUF3352 domain-containing protein [Candidatus Gracilibacteria bacterium]